MNRRDFLRANRSICAGWALSRAVPVLADTPAAGEWRTFEVVTTVELLKPNAISHIWLPAPLIRNTPYQNTISTRFTAMGGTATLSKDKQSALGIVSARYAANAKPSLSMTSRVALKNYTVDLSSRATAPPASQTELDYYLQPSRYVPTGRCEEIDFADFIRVWFLIRNAHLSLSNRSEGILARSFFD
jgi:hypothetical protein